MQCKYFIRERRSRESLLRPEVNARSWQRLRFYRQNGRKISDDSVPRVASVCRRVNLPASGAKVHAARIERVNRHRVSEHVHVAIALRQTFRELFPLVAAGPAAINAQFAIGR